MGSGLVLRRGRGEVSKIVSICICTCVCSVEAEKSLYATISLHLKETGLYP